MHLSIQNSWTAANATEEVKDHSRRIRVGCSLMLHSIDIDWEWTRAPFRASLSLISFDCASKHIWLSSWNLRLECFWDP
jgi:hypothetical protein